MARTKKKDYIAALREAAELSKDNRIKTTNTLFTNFFKSEFSDSAIEVFEKTLLNSSNKYVGYKNGGIREGLADAYLEAALYYSRNGEFENADEILTKLLGTDRFASNGKFHKKVAYELTMVLLRKELSKENPDLKGIERLRGTLSEEAKGDFDNVLETEIQGKVSDYDLFKAYFNTVIPAEEISQEIFPENMVGMSNGGSRDRNRRIIGDEFETRQYGDQFSAINRLRFIQDHFNVKSALMGSGKFKGSIIFNIENSDVVLVEKFWDEKNGIPVESYGKATYIIPKDVAINLTEMTRGEIRARREEDSRIQVVNHNGDYYNRLLERFHAAERNIPNDTQAVEKPPVQNVTPKPVSSKRKTRVEVGDVGEAKRRLSYDLEGYLEKLHGKEGFGFSQP